MSQAGSNKSSMRKGTNRQINYTKDEVEILINEVQKRKKILFSSLTNSITNQVKEKEWQEVASRVSSVGPVVRTAAQVRNKWSDFASRTKKKNSAFNRAARVTGGGVNPMPRINEEESKVLSVLGPIAVDGIQGAIDTDDTAMTTCEGETTDSSMSESESIYITDSSRNLVNEGNEGSSIPHQPARTKHSLPESKVISEGKSPSEQMLEIEKERLLIEKEHLKMVREQNKSLQEIAEILRQYMQHPTLTVPQSNMCRQSNEYTENDHNQHFFTYHDLS